MAEPEATSGTISVAGLESQLVAAAGAAVARDVLAQLQPALVHAEECAKSTKSYVARGGGGGLAVLVALALFAWNAWGNMERARAERDKDIDGQLTAITASLAESTGKEKERDVAIAALKSEVVRLTRAVNALSRSAWPGEAEPAAAPFVIPDAVTSATR